MILSRKMLKRVGESRHPCRTPSVVLNHSPVLPLNRTALWALSYRFETGATKTVEQIRKVFGDKGLLSLVLHKMPQWGDSNEYRHVFMEKCGKLYLNYTQIPTSVPLQKYWGNIKCCSLGYLFQSLGVISWKTAIKFQRDATITWARSCKNISYAICEQQRRRSACASAQSDQHLCCLLHR